MKTLKNLFLAVAIAAAWLTTSTDAQAAFQLRLYTSVSPSVNLNTPDQVVIDAYTPSGPPVGGAGADSNAAQNKITVNDLNFVGVMISTTTGAAIFPDPFNGNLATITTSDLMIQNSSGGTKTFTLAYVRDDFPAPGGVGDIVAVSGRMSILETSGTGITGSYFSRIADSQGSAQTNTLTFSAPIASVFPLFTNGANFLRSDSTFTLFDVIQVTLPNMTSISLQTRTLVNPAPAGLVLALTGLPLLGFAGWRRRRAALVAA